MAQVTDLVGQLPTRKGAEPYFLRNLDEVDTVGIHYTGVPSLTVTAESTAQWQTTKTDGILFLEVAYHAVVERERVVLCHDPEKVTWGIGGRESKQGVSLNNWRTIHICVTGFGIDGMPSGWQMVQTRLLYRWFEGLLGKSLYLKGHKEMNPSHCPGNRWLEWKWEVELR